MAIRVASDVGAPLVTVAVDLITESYAPDWNKWASYILAGGGYLAAWTGWGSDFMKNVGISSFPWAAKNIYEAVRGIGVRPSQRMTMRKAVGRYPGPADKAPYQGVKLT